MSPPQNANAQAIGLTDKEAGSDGDEAMGGADTSRMTARQRARQGDGGFGEHLMMLPEGKWHFASRLKSSYASIRSCRAQIQERRSFCPTSRNKGERRKMRVDANCKWTKRWRMTGYVYLFPTDQLVQVRSRYFVIAERRNQQATKSSDRQNTAKRGAKRRDAPVRSRWRRRNERRRRIR